MTLAFRPDETHPLVSALLADLGIAPGTFDSAVDARDEMLGFLVQLYGGDRDQALFQYFRSGASIADSLGQVLRWRFPDPGRTVKLLDFASGYGRVTRFLLRQMPAESVWVADVYAGGVRFQEERFGVHGIVSAIRPEDFVCGERFDAILVTSLFTHLPEERFVAWLRVLLGLLAPGGLLAFSTHSPEVLPADIKMPPAGDFLFQPISESGSLDKSDYGSAWMTEAFVRSALERALAPGAPGPSFHRIERALCNFQDLYLVLPEPGVDFSSLTFQGEPQLFVERAELLDSRLEVTGWAAARHGTVREVEVWLDAERLAVAPVEDERGDVAGFLGSDRRTPTGWRCVCQLPAGASRSVAVLRLRVVDGRGDRGHGHVLWAGSVEGLLLAFIRLDASLLRGHLRRAEDSSTQESARAATAEAERSVLQARIAAMEASRFWKLRNAWFRLKARVGLAS
ncbi:MAG: hypothetical protein QOF89_2199 [Acidobacteriota bacterium]|jgi:SAM-dependent methyltransferase|nr:hypothetical protein [Acidobacteriota bacterium]